MMMDFETLGNISHLENESADSQRFKEVMAENEALVRENRLFSSYLNRHIASDADFNDNDTDRPARSREAKKLQRLQTGLTTIQRFALAQQELTQLQKELAEMDLRSSKDIADLNAMLGETKMRINELKKEAYEFKRDVVIGAENPRTKKIMAERVVRHFEEQLRAKEALIEKIKLKNTALKNQIQKLDLQLKQKEEQGDSLHSIDFHQLKIENSQFNTKIKERNSELLKLKMTTGKTVQVLNTAKKELGDIISESKRLQADVKDREEMCIRLTQELDRIEDDVKRESKKRDNFAAQQTSSVMPQVLDYVGQKAEHYQLQSDLRNWERKVAIADLSTSRKSSASPNGLRK